MAVVGQERFRHGQSIQSSQGSWHPGDGRLTSGVPVAPTRAPSQVSLLAAKGYRFPCDGAFHAAVRNADEPAETRVIPGNRIRVMGNSQKATFPIIPADLLGGRAYGKPEVQLQDDHAGASDWLPLPATFLDLPVVVAVQDPLIGLCSNDFIAKSRVAQRMAGTAAPTRSVRPCRLIPPPCMRWFRPGGWGCGCSPMPGG
jgi:hypothetical protein